MNNDEALTKEEIEKLHELQAKQKRIQRAQKKDERFLKEADRRKDELLARWGMSDEVLAIHDNLYMNMSDDTETINTNGVQGADAPWLDTEVRHSAYRY